MEPNQEITVTGAVYKPLHVERQVKIYPIQESEMRIISTFNGQFAFWCSVGTSAAVLMLSCIWDLCITAEWPANSAWAFMTLCLAVAIVASALARWNWNNRNEELQRILSQTRQASDGSPSITIG